MSFEKIDKQNRWAMLVFCFLGTLGFTLLSFAQEQGFYEPDTAYEDYSVEEELFYLGSVKDQHRRRHGYKPGFRRPLQGPNDWMYMTDNVYGLGASAAGRMSRTVHPRFRNHHRGYPSYPGYHRSFHR